MDAEYATYRAMTKEIQRLHGVCHELKTHVKLYLVNNWTPCECEQECACQEASLDSVWLDQEKAEKQAAKLFQGFVQESFTSD